MVNDFTLSLLRMNELCKQRLAHAETRKRREAKGGEKQGGKTMSKHKVLIIGGGVAGPALALFLQRAGIESALYEAGEKADDQAGSFLNVA